MSDVYYKTSNITGRTYNVFEIIRVLNPKQVAFFLSQGIELQDIIVSEDRKDGSPILVFYFIKNDTKAAFDLWCKRKEGTS